MTKPPPSIYSGADVTEYAEYAVLFFLDRIPLRVKCQNLCDSELPK